MLKESPAWQQPQQPPGEAHVAAQASSLLSETHPADDQAKGFVSNSEAGKEFKLICMALAIV